VCECSGANATTPVARQANWRARRAGVVTRPLGPGVAGVALVLAWRRDDMSATVAAFRDVVAEQRAIQGVAPRARPT